LYTNPAAAGQYKDLYTVLQQDNADGPVFVSALAPWAYLCTDRPVGAPTTWRIYADSTVLQGYYEVHPNRRPETVLILAEEMGAYVSTIQPEDNPAPHTPAQEGVLLEELAANYAAKETPAGTLYRLKG
ncbi:MAG: hypothetical protein IIV90_03025, partial [Oscillospiraceae bacterium]|nr:hypothetical protein [Oscillospiraceae bacterium]